MRRRRQGLQVSTFPFLAVLLCTMGSLILLLLVIDRRARVVARVKALQAAAQTGAFNEKTEAARREEWERRSRALHEQLVCADRDVQAQLVSLRGKEREEAGRAGAERSELSALRQRIQAEAAKLAHEDQELTAHRATIAAKQQEATTSHEAMSGLTTDLLRLEKTLAEVKAARLKQQQTYSLVPYRGKRGDSRKPIYIECASGGLVFHPDSKNLGGFDISAMDYRKEVIHRLASGEHDYLLLLVRPDGISSYYRLVGALQGLKVDYGYEFIDRDWALDFSGEQAQPWMLAEKTKPPDVDSSPGKSRRVIGVAAGTPISTANPDAPPSHGSTSNQPGTSAGPSNNVSGFRGDRPGIPLAHAEPERSGGPGIGLPHSPGGLSALSPGSSNGLSISPVGGQGTPGLGGGSGPSGVPTGSIAPGGGTSQVGMLPTGPTASAAAATGGPAANAGLPDQAAPAGAGAMGSTASIGPPVATGTAPVSVPQGSGSKSQLPAPPPLLPQTETNQAKAQTPGSSSGSPGVNGSAGSSASSGGGDGEGSGLPAAPNPLDKLAGPRKRPVGLTTLRPILFNRNRDWFIKIDCYSDRIVIEGTGQVVASSTLVGADPSANPLIQGVHAMIERRQATVPDGDIPYRPLIRFRVHPDGVRAYYLAYPALEALNVPLSRENLEAEDGSKP
jgi:hypothetical protein